MMPRVGARPATAAPAATTDRPAREGRFATNGDGAREPVGARGTDTERRV
jgi:hypothetical protein